MATQTGGILGATYASVILAIVLFLASGTEAHAGGVFFAKKLGLDANQYRVTGAQGTNEAKALKAARVAALVFAGESLSGDSSEKRAIGDYLDHNGAELLGLTNAGRITRRTFGSGGSKIMVDVRVDVQIKDLRLKLEAARIIKASAELSESVGNPTILVVYSDLQENKKK